MRLLTTWSFGLRCGRGAWSGLIAGGTALDAVEATCIAAESDPDIDSVGFGGLPDRDGRVTLDGCVMCSPRRCGSVCAVTGTRHPVTLARLVMERTPHVMLAGAGADAFAQTQGLPRGEGPLLSASAHEAWREWTRSGRAPDQSQDCQSGDGDLGVGLGVGLGVDPSVDPGVAHLRPVDRGPSGGGLFSRSAALARPAPRPESAVEEGATRGTAGVPDRRLEDPNRHHDTIGVLAIDAAGTIAGACSTSGTPFKLPGRVGDSPIIGHGLYVDPRVGGASATGAGELIMGVCGSFAVVELMRQGREPLAAITEVLRRIAEDGEVRPHHQVAFIAMTNGGAWASGALRWGYKTTIFGDAPEPDGRVAEPDFVIWRV
jgi:isoaspartyl peptidase/L-asparaginase-like protein (Ntn-hydrolase superfamily)